MSKTYQKDHHRAQRDRQPGEIVVPEQVIVSMAEIAESAKEGLLALAVGTGMQVMAAMFGEDAERLCGPDGKHNPDRAGYRHGSEAGSVWERHRHPRHFPADLRGCSICACAEKTNFSSRHQARQHLLS